MKEYIEFLESANCRGVDPDIFFPAPRDWQALKAAKAVCAECIVKAECLDRNIDEPYGVYGGTSARARQTIRRQRPSIDTDR